MRTGPKSILGLGTPLSLRGPLCPGKGGGVLPVPPSGFALLKGADGRYLQGRDGKYLFAHSDEVDEPIVPVGFALLRGRDGFNLQGADGAYLYGKAA